MYIKNQGVGMDFETKFFTDLTNRLDSMEKKLDDIQSKVIYMYGFAAAIGFFASFIIDWIRTAMAAHATPVQ